MKKTPLDQIPATELETPFLTPKKRMSLRKKLLVIIAVILGLAVITAGLGYVYFNNLLGKMDQEKIADNDKDLGIGDTQDNSSISVVSSANSAITKDENAELAKLPYYFEGVKGITNIVLFGIDTQDGVSGRSDTIIILTVDTRTDKIKLSSIVRDSYVYIPGRGMDKINHAHAFGGAQLAIKTINTNFHLDIRRYISVNFTSLPKIIDKLGGVEVTITEKEFPQVPGITAAGTYNLTGSQALAFARIRKIDSDFERSRRQRDVIEAAIKKMFTQPVTSYPNIMSEVFPLLKTNMSSTEMLGIGMSTVINNIRTIEKMRYPTSASGKGQNINHVYYFVFDRARMIHEMGKYIYLDQK